MFHPFKRKRPLFPNNTAWKGWSLSSVMFWKQRALVGQPLAAFGAPSGQNLSSVLGSHSFPKSVFFLPMKLFGLIGSFHRSCSSFPRIGLLAFSVIYLKSIPETVGKSQPLIFIFYLHIVFYEISFTVSNGFLLKNAFALKEFTQKSGQKRCGTSEVVVQFKLRNHRIFWGCCKEQLFSQNPKRDKIRFFNRISTVFSTK